MTAVDISCGIALHADMHMHSMQAAAAAAAMMVAESEMAVFPRGALLLREILIERSLSLKPQPSAWVSSLDACTFLFRQALEYVDGVFENTMSTW
jgi:hypothetical protein